MGSKQSELNILVDHCWRRTAILSFPEFPDYDRSTWYVLEYVWSYVFGFKHLWTCIYAEFPHLCLWAHHCASFPVTTWLPVFPWGLEALDNQRAHKTETLLVLNSHRWQLSNPPAGSNGLQSVKHKTWRPFTVNHLKLLETGRARHMLSKWQGLLITQEVRQR